MEDPADPKEKVLLPSNTRISNTRISVKKFHKHHALPKGTKSTAKILQTARFQDILIGPFIYTNTGTDVELLSCGEKGISYWEKCTSDPSVTYAVLLSGAHSMVVFRNGANTLTFAEAIIPSFPGESQISTLKPRESGRLWSDPYPHGWDELDWEVFHLMRNPQKPFPEIARILRERHSEDEYCKITWQTVRNRFLKIVRDCKTWISFFPYGLFNYHHFFASFETDYETGLYKELGKLDRTSYIYKHEGGLMLFAYLCDFREQKLFT